MAKRPPRLAVVQRPNAPDQGTTVLPETPQVNDEALSDAPVVDTHRALLELTKAIGRDARKFFTWLAPTLRSALVKFRNSVTTGISVAWATSRNRSGSDETSHLAEAQAGSPTSGNDLVTRSPKDHAGLRRKLLFGGALVAFVCVVAIASLMVWALHDVPFGRIASGHADNKVIALTTSDGQPLIQRGPYQEAAASRDEFPDALVEAVLAIEDRRFAEHWGIDVFGIARALGRNVSAGQVLEGGSTITQQLLKILYLDQERTLRRKVQELFLSMWLESRLSKDEILTLYLNNVYLGAGATGMPAAARVYFNKAVGDLTIAESALLAGLIASPSSLNPIKNLDGARDRAAVVLQAMQSAGFLDEDAARQAQLNSAQLQPQRPELGTGTWFADWVMQEAQETSGQFIGSVKVTTTLVPDLQYIAEQSVRSVMRDNAVASGATQAAMVVLAPDGAVVAMVGGLDYAESEFNRALAMRQPGSTFKLFTYYAALKLGATPDSRLDDTPIEIDGWAPQNFDGEYAGRVSMAEAFARSLNVATVGLGMEVGLPNVIAAARELGIDAPLQETPSLILGASEVSLLDITGAYASVRAGIAPIEAYGIATFEAPNGRPFTIGPPVEAALPLGAVQAPMFSLLQLVVERGTGQAALLDRPAGGKTGTSQDYRDAWFIGFDGNYTVGVWVGNDDGSPMDKVTGGQLPAMIWHAFMTDAVPPAGSMLTLAPDEGANQAPDLNAPHCNIQLCAQSYRSFRASDCTFQPYSGPRRICEK
ncbi:MAG: PBP1A family penicillin-binding protein [Alphaproteobacteria bacterium]|nr:PBP1A family penicillin-binding protein [Alphaproteobacteria bacterium]MBU1561706.1 PBP1A family penicillin-binding protein [Alphaproteobacteria bacterium]MBU2303020.1 PBP1A family penicillin-binding protein [Alphaproteobacteria bacterium]MBU2368806.1 PBP1A family penicillin-binding protein [Alphaproteobacteria bacterium]